ncbi:unnamed protein product [Urochloa humidicola]
MNLDLNQSGLVTNILIVVEDIQPQALTRSIEDWAVLLPEERCCHRSFTCPHEDLDCCHDSDVELSSGDDDGQ